MDFVVSNDEGRQLDGVIDIIEAVFLAAKGIVIRRCVYLNSILTYPSESYTCFCLVSLRTATRPLMYDLAIEVILGPGNALRGLLVV